jgi:hypothetical protein
MQFENPPTVDKFKVRPDDTTVTASAKTQPVSGDGVSGGPPAPKNAPAASQPKTRAPAPYMRSV